MRIAVAHAESIGPGSVYRLDVPGDRPDTAEREGPVEGEAFELRVAGAPASLSTWLGGELSLLDLDAAQGADVGVSLTDGTTSVAAGSEVDYLVAAENLGPGPASGVVVRVALPPGVTPSAIGGGGIFDGEVVTWSLGAIGEAESVTRTLRARFDSSFPAGVQTIELVATIEHDGATGGDPVPSNDRSVDSDLLEAAPDLSVSLSDARTEVSPGETLVYRALGENLGSQGATGAQLSVALPPGVEFYSASHGGVRTGGDVAWPPFALEAGAAIERSVTVRLPPDLPSAVTELAGSATVADDGTNGADLDPGNNDALDLDSVRHAPDLIVTSVSDAPTTTDSQTLRITGEVLVAISNRGSVAAPASRVVVFSDSDGDGVYDVGLDSLLGSAIHASLAPGAGETSNVPVDGIVRFLGDRVFAMVDADLEVAELDEGNNVGDDSSGCAVAPSPAPFAPIVKRHWPPVGGAIYRPSAVDSLSTPIAVQLTDDNGDGLWDDRDVPDLVFVTTDLTYLLEPQVVLRAVHGDSLAPIFDVDGFFPHPTAPTLLSFSGLAAADIDHDGKPEILSTTFGPAAVNYLRAYEHTGALKWISQPFHTHPSPTGLTNRDNPTVADLDGDGEPEIVVGANVFDRFGHLRWSGSLGQAFQSSGNSGDRGGAISVVADLDLDGRLEVVAGNTVYRHDGAVAWTSPLPDGYPAVADFDDDPRPEIVVVAAGTVRLHDSDGALLWGPLPLPGSDPEAGGAPTVGDFDGDGRPEIGVAGSDVYVVFDGDGSILWQASTQDYSSNLTGSTSFDLDGDGALEIVYRDERRLRIYRGLDGVVLFEMPISSNTWTEEPIVVDVDRDGNAEIVVSSDRAPDVALPPGERTSGLFVLGDGGDGWISARGIWHQHAYSPEQIEEDARVPASPAWGWLDHNSFRANVPRSAEPWAGPDLTASRIVPDLTALPDVAVTVRIGNGGRVPIGPGLEVAFYDGDPTFGGLLVGTATLGAGLDAGGFVDVATHLQIADLASGRLTVVADDDGGGSGRERECDEANNSASVLLDTSPLGLWLELDDGVDSLGAGDPTTYAIQVHNAYPAEATGVVLTDILPEHTTLLAASDGGEVAAGVVTWPPTSIPPGARIVRTLTLEVDAAIPFAVNSIVNQASVTDDGAQGPDPTPENNLATDTDQVTTVTADAGGPYSAAEGAPILLDGSGSFDRDGTIVAYAWDLDGDGIFGDASGPLVSWTPPGEGVWPLALEVTDDSGESDTDATQATVGNEPPVVTGPTELVGVEGTPVSLEAVHCSDPNDPLTATVDWGDGTVEATAIVGGMPVATHRYPDDGTYPLSICVSDGSAPEVCIAPTAQIANAAPEVLETVGFDFQSWSPTELGGGATTAWSISTGGRVATESSNGEPTFLVGEMDSFGTYELSLRVADPADDDFVGLAFGFEPDDLTDPTARYFLLDWRRWYQSGATPGLALSEVTGIPSTYELWLHEDQANNGPSNGVREIARAATLGAIGWDRHRDYRFRIEHSPSHLRVWVDDSLELDVEAAFQPGRLALYDYSQAQAIFTALESRVTLVGFEGEPASLVARFTDAGIADTHVAHIAWGDGATESISPAEENGAGEIAVGHVYADDGTPALEVCVDDDDGATDCQPIPARIWNRPPRLALAVASTGFLDDPVSLDGTTFTDPGTLDSHTATVDWGDGTVEPAIVLPTGTGGSVGGSHLYPTPGTFAVRLCVVDDDGDSDCDEVSVSVVERRLDLGVSIASDVSGVRPGAVVGLNVVGENHGSLPATGVVTTATVPPHTTFLTASDGGTVAQGVVTWPLGPLAPTETASRRFEVSVDLDAPVGGTLVAEASIADDGLSGPDAVPANDHAVAELHVSGPLTPIVELPYAPAGVEGLPLSLLDATWNDTTANEAHTGTVDWGDGLLESVTLTPSRGVAGAIAATHTYLEDGVYPLTVCVRDAQGNVGCAAREATVVNAPPILVEPGAVLLDYWLDEQYDNFAGDLRAEWIVAADGLSVRQRINSRPSIFLSPLPAFDTTLEGTIRVGSQGNWDDDFIGFVLGFRPGDTRNAGADFLLVDWKQASQWGARRGLALSRVSGIPAGDEFWIHSGHLTELARGFTLGDRGWADNREYRFRFEYSSDRLRLWVDDVLQFDLEGDFPDGNFGFYNYSQQDVYYRGFSSGLDVRYEGEELELRAPFVDPGVLDTHQGTVDWDDGQSEALAAQSSDGFGLLAATHGYDDDGDFSIAVCIEDDEHAEDCGTFPLVVQNLPPIVVPAQTSPAIANAPWSGRLATFTDPGRLDSHVAEVDWGDGMRTPGQVTDDAGAGIVEGAHTWSEAGTFETEVCVLDDDGGEGCELVTVVVLDSPPSLRASKTYTAIDRDGDGVVGPGDDLLYRIEISNSGPTAATGVVLVDPVPAHTSLVPGSATPALLVTESDPLVAEIPRIESGASLVVQFAVTIDPSLPAGVSEIVNSGIVECDEQSPIATDDPSLPGNADPTRTPVFVDVGLAATKSAALVDHDGDGVATPGDEIVWTISVSAVGNRAAGGVVVSDPIPADTELLPDTITSSRGEVLGVDPVLVSLGALEAGGVASISFHTRIASDLDPEVEQIENQAFVLGDGFDLLPSDDPETPAPLDPTRVPVYVHPHLALVDAAVLEGDVGATPLPFALTLDHAARLPVSVDWTLVGNDATAGEDFVPESGTLSIPPGDLTASLTASVLGDSVVEPDETLRVELSNPVFVYLDEVSATGIILNDDATSFELSDATADEGSTLLYSIALLAPSAMPVSVAWQTADGSALAGVDYVPDSGILTLAPYQTTATIEVATIDDGEHEPDETMRLLFSDATGASLPDPEAVGTILDDDPDCILSCAEALTVATDPGACGAWVALPEPGVTGSCGPVICEPPTGAFFAVGTTEVVCSATSVAASCSFPVTVEDVEPPIVTAPTVTVGNDPGACAASVYWEVEVSDNCPGAHLVTCDPLPGAALPVGTTAVECQGIDAAGNESAGSGSVTVLDLEPPALASCPPDGQVSAPPGALSWPFEYSVPAATDNCPGVDVACAPPSGEAFPVGATSVACVAVDASDLTDQCGFEVVVEGRPVVEIPTLSRGALAILGLLLSVVACAALRSSRSRREG